MRKLYWALALVLLTQASCAWAEFSTAEKAEVQEAASAASKGRDALREVAKAVRYGTTDMSRAALDTLQLRTIEVVSPMNIVPLYMLHGSTSGFHAFSLGSECNKPANGTAQSVFLGCAWGAADIALGRFAAARTAIATAQTHNPGQTDYQNALSAALTLLNNTTGAEGKLLGVDRTLAYADPSPASEVTVTGLEGADPASFLDDGRIIGPHGPYVHVMEQAGDGYGAYAMSAIGILRNGYSKDALLTDYVHYEKFVRVITFAQDEGSKALLRNARIQGGEAGESSDPDWRTRLLRNFRGIFAVDRAAGNFYVAAQEFKELVKQGLGVSPYDGGVRINFLTAILGAAVDIQDAWHRYDDGFGWRWSFIPESPVQ